MVVAGQTKQEGKPVVSRQIITFRIGEQYLGTDIMAVREIRAWSTTSPLPHAPKSILGVVNLRGSVVPVTDLSFHLGWGVTTPSDRHVIIVLQLGSDLHGLIVDAVSDIVTLTADNMQPAPAFADAANSELLEGVATVEDRMIMVLQLNKLATDQPGEAPLAA